MRKIDATAAVALAICLCAAGQGTAFASDEAGAIASAQQCDQTQQAASDAADNAGDSDGSSDDASTDDGIIRKTKSITMHVNAVRSIEVVDKSTGYQIVESHKWRSSDKSVAKVSKDGLVTAKKRGNATITYKSATRLLTYKLTVKKSNFKPVPMTKLACYKCYRAKYMSAAQFKKAYKKALKLVRPAGDMSKKNKLNYVTWTLRSYFDNGGSYSTSSAHYNDPYGYFVKRSASCAGCARATGLALNILGIKFEHVNENQWTHQWCRVKVGKSYWIADPYGLYCGKEPAKRKHPYL